jgi:uncharacterized protein with NRDE domain
MCLIAYAWQVHPRWPLVLIGNRDELHARPASSADFQPDAPQVYGGRDLEKQGGWLQVSTQRRLAAVTNVRHGIAPEPAKRSRGALVADFVRNPRGMDEWLAALAPDAPSYGRFNLLVWDGERLSLLGNHPTTRTRLVEPGVHGLFNGDFDAPWPKVGLAQQAMRRWLDHAGDAAEPDVEILLAALATEQVAPDAELPDTGVGIELERLLSSPFIRGTRYGTRCSSVVLVGHDEALFVERRYGPDGIRSGESRQRLSLAPR